MRCDLRLIQDVAAKHPNDGLVRRLVEPVSPEHSEDTRITFYLTDFEAEYLLNLVDDTELKAKLQTSVDLANAAATVQSIARDLDG